MLNSIISLHIPSHRELLINHIVIYCFFEHIVFLLVSIHGIEIKNIR